MKKIKQNIPKILPSILGCLCLLFAGLTSLNSCVVDRTATCKLVANEGKECDYGYSFAALNYGENSYSTLSSIFSQTIGLNFSGYMQTLPVSLESETNELTSFSAKLSGTTLAKEVHFGDCVLYSNQKELNRFETLLINVYDNNTFTPRINQYNVDGFVFLPDFYADELISNSNGLYNSYDDLLPKSSSKEDAQNAKTLQISNNGQERTWAIVGIYHSRGFEASNLQKAFEYNDKNYGSMLNDFGAPLLIAWDSAFSRQYINGLMLCLDSKQYLIEQMCQKFGQYVLEESGDCSFFAVRDGVAEKVIDVPASLFLASKPSAFYFIYLILTSCIAVAFYFSIRKLNFTKAYLFLCETSLVPFVFGILSTIFLTFSVFKNPFILRFFSYYFGLFVLILMLEAIGCLAYKIYLQRRKKNEI